MPPLRGWSARSRSRLRLPFTTHHPLPTTHHDTQEPKLNHFCPMPTRFTLENTATKNTAQDNTPTFVHPERVSRFSSQNDSRNHEKSSVNAAVLAGGAGVGGVNCRTRTRLTVRRERAAARSAARTTKSAGCRGCACTRFETAEQLAESSIASTLGRVSNEWDQLFRLLHKGGPNNRTRGDSRRIIQGLDLPEVVLFATLVYWRRPEGVLSTRAGCGSAPGFLFTAAGMGLRL